MNFGLTPRAGDGRLDRPQLRRERALPARGGGRADRRGAGRGRARDHAQGAGAGLLRAQHPRGIRRRRARSPDLHAARARAGAGVLRAVGVLGPAVQHPVRLQRGAAGALSAAGGARRAGRLPRHDRARGRLGRALDEDHGPARRRRLGDRRHQAFHQPRRHRRLRDRVRGDRHRGDQGRAEAADHLLPGRPRHARLRDPARLQERLAPRLPQLHPQLRRLPGARRPDPGRGGQGLRADEHLALRHPADRRRHQRRPGAPRVRSRGRVGGEPQAVRPADRQVPGHLVQARRHGDRDRRRRPARRSTAPGCSTRAWTPTG